MSSKLSVEFDSCLICLANALKAAAVADGSRASFSFGPKHLGKLGVRPVQWIHLNLLFRGESSEEQVGIGQSKGAAFTSRVQHSPWHAARVDSPVAGRTRVSSS